MNYKLGQITSGPIRRIGSELSPQKYVCLIFKLGKQIVERSRGDPGENGAKQEVLLRSPPWLGLTM